MYEQDDIVFIDQMDYDEESHCTMVAFLTDDHLAVVTYCSDPIHNQESERRNA